MSGTPITDALARLRDDPEQATSRPEPHVSIGVVETFYPVEAGGTDTSQVTDGTEGDDTDGDEQAPPQDTEEPPDSGRDTDGPKVDVRDSITGVLHRRCPILVDSYGDVSALPPDTPVVIERTGPLGMCVTAIRYTGESSSPSIESEERRLRIGEMALELSRDSQGRAVGRMGHQPDDGSDHNAAFIVREDGSIEGYSAGGVGFCFKADGSFYVSGMLREGGGGTPGSGAPGGGPGGGGGLPSGTGTIGGGAGYSDIYGPADGDTVVTRDASYAGAMGSASGTVFIEDDVETGGEGLSGNGITIAGNRGATSEGGGGGRSIVLYRHYCCSHSQRPRRVLVLRQRLPRRRSGRLLATVAGCRSRTITT